MKSIPLTTKVLLVLLVGVSIRFFWIFSTKLQTEVVKPISKQKITAPQVEQILTCQQYADQIRACTSEAMVCLQGIAASKKFYEENEQKIVKCQAQNEKNLLLNKELRVKLDAVTERLDGLVNRRNRKKQTTEQTEL